MVVFRQLSTVYIFSVMCVSLQAELSGLSGDNYARLAEMRERSEGLRSAREEKRQQASIQDAYCIQQKFSDCCIDEAVANTF